MTPAQNIKENKYHQEGSQQLHHKALLLTANERSTHYGNSRTHYSVLAKHSITREMEHQRTNFFPAGGQRKTVQSHDRSIASPLVIIITHAQTKRETITRQRMFIQIYHGTQKFVSPRKEVLCIFFKLYLPFLIKIYHGKRNYLSNHPMLCAF